MQEQDAYHQSSLFGTPQAIRHPDITLTSFPTIVGDIPSDGNARRFTYGQARTRFGLLTLASADGIIVHGHLGDRPDEGIVSMRRMFPDGGFDASEDPNLAGLVRYLENPACPASAFRVAVTGTPFQVEVWQALLRIPFGGRVSYGELAAMVGRPNAVRAVGTAVGRNPVAYLVPCHRVVRTGGGMGGYMWGVERKREVLAWEASMFAIGH
jgi:AraC family transcriptional regulator of adaptative response/methylated-DNA-[protein]-cysteine methyltransferase